MKVVCIGAGNVATHLSTSLQSAGARIIQVYSHTQANAAALACVLGADPIDDLSALDRSADLYVISVRDDAITTVAAALAGVAGLVVHTSGATPLSALSGFERYGVLYPLQTFSKSREIAFAGIPLCLEANDAATMGDLKKVAALLGPLMYEVNSENRKALHLAAVFACNFTNHLYHLGARILQERELDFEMLRPLIQETANKVQHALPFNMQTGPAIRDDQATIKRHVEELHDMPELAALYEILSNSIKNTYL